MPQDSLELRRRATREFAIVSVLVYLLVAALLFVPASFLATGVQALGAGLGWWAGDPDAKAGEELVGTVVGVVSVVIVLVVAAATVRALGRRYLRPVRLPILVGTAVILAGVVAVCVRVVAG